MVIDGNVNRVMITFQSSAWGRAVQELLAESGLKQAELARRAGIAPPGLFRYLQGQRVPPISRLRTINAALAQMLGEPNVGAYLNAIATRDGLLPADERFEEDFGDELSLVAAHMREGFLEALRSELRDREDAGRPFIDDLVSEVRERLIRHIKGQQIKETRLESFLRLAKTNGLPGHDWLKSNTEIESARRKKRLDFELQEILRDTPLSTQDRIRCESRIRALIADMHLEERERQLAERMREIESAERIGRLEAESKIYSKLSKGEPLP
jgi:transcriptional regulator with XRE-family HTH domain